MQASPGFYEPEITSRENRNNAKIKVENKENHMQDESDNQIERLYKQDIIMKSRGMKYKKVPTTAATGGFLTSQEELVNNSSNLNSSPHVMIKVPMIMNSNKDTNNAKGTSSSSAAAISDSDMINIQVPSNNGKHIIVQCVGGSQKQLDFYEQSQMTDNLSYSSSSSSAAAAAAIPGPNSNYPLVLLQKPKDKADGSKYAEENQALLPNKNHVAWSKLRNLEDLFKEGIITDVEYKERRQQLVDELTGTKSLIYQNSTSAISSYSSLSSFNSSTGDEKNRTRRSSSRSFSPIVVPRPPPDFSVIQPEQALKIYFDLPTRTWTTKQITVRLDDTPFARGGLRLVYHILEEGSSPPRSGVDTISRSPLSPQPQPDIGSNKSCLSNIPLTQSIIERPSFCAKMAIDPNEDPSSYFRDVEMQAHCAYYAAKFNEYNPPRRVEFCKAWILELLERDGSPLVCVERFIAGPYRKHNNNFGYVSDDERNTPQAFSHFTYEVSAHTLLVVDIQGVGDLYTDPQIHTITGRDFGKGNLGLKGFEKFLKTHRCNSICRFLKLPPVNPKYTADGTVPALPYMLPAKIEKEKFEASHIFERTPALQKYLYGRNMSSSEDDLYNIQRVSGSRRRKSISKKNSLKKGFYHEDKDAFFWSASEEESCSWCQFPACTIL